MKALGNGIRRNAAGRIRQGLFGLAMCGLSGVLLTLGGCGSGGSGGVSPTATAQTGAVAGQVVSAANNTPVAGATVRTSAGATTSAADGTFTVPAPVGDRSVVDVEANGFAEAFPVARVTIGQTTSLGVKLLTTGVSATVTVANGGTVTVPSSTAQVILPANGLVPKNGGAVAGTVTVSVTPINPAIDPNVMPGDYTGVSAGGSTPIESFGALLVDIRDNAGSRYNLATGRTATIRIPLGTLSLNPPATIPLWYFDETTGLWQEEGTATLQGAAPNRYYEGTVAHFSYWNADRPLERVFVSGCVRDNSGQPVANAWVETRGQNYTGIAVALTGADGAFRVAMRINSTATLGLFEFDLQTFTYTALTNTVNVGPSAVDFTLPNCLVKAPGPVTITTDVLPGGTVGVGYNQTLTASSGIPGYVWSLNSGSNPLPAGLSLSSAGIISGIPTTAGTTAIVVRVTDSASGTAIKPLNLTTTAVGAISITTASPLPSGVVGAASTIPLIASGGAGTLSWSVASGALPVGMTLNPSTAIISGTPTTAGTSTFTIRVQDSGSPQQVDQKPFALTVTAVASTCPPVCPTSGAVTVSNAPASVGGAFNGNVTSQSVGGVVWGEDFTATSMHFETFVAILYNSPSLTYQLIFSSSDPGVSHSWTCVFPAVPGFTTCSGVTINQAGGTLTLVNTVLSGVSGIVAPPITMNGTLNFTPF